MYEIVVTTPEGIVVEDSTATLSEARDRVKQLRVELGPLRWIIISPEGSAVAEGESP